MDSKVQDNNKMATAPLGKLMTELAVPTVFAQLVNLLYNMVDRIYVGRIPEVGHLALAGLGVTFPVIILISAICGPGGSRGSAPGSHLYGKEGYEGGRADPGELHHGPVHSGSGLKRILLCGEGTAADAVRSQ